MYKNDEIIDFLQKTFLFKYLNDWQLSQLALDMELIHINQTGTVYLKNEPAEHIYFILRGRVELDVKKGQKIRRFAVLKRGDYLGEDCIKSSFYRERAVALEDVTLLKYPKAKLIAIQNDYPIIKEMISATAISREMTRNKPFDWLGDDEAVYIIARKHEFFLFLKLFGLFLIWLLAIPFVEWFDVSSLVLNNAIIILGILITTGIGIWLWKDWGNDYYVVTNKRVIWIEKSPFLYESRQEAPLTSVLSLKVLSLSVLRYLIDYGNLIVKTYTDEIPMLHVRSPGLLIEFINGLQLRKQEITKGNEYEVMDAALRKRLQLSQGKSLDKKYANQDADADEKMYTSHGMLYDRLVNVRFKDEEKIIYRKHWFVLIKKVWIQSLIILGVLIIFYFLMQAETTNPITSGFWIAFFIVVIGIWVYQFLDWRNDVYIITREKIYNIERKPLGRENKKSALLENILSLEHNRVGLIGLFLNYGTVTVNIGAEKFEFYNVYNPAHVQNEIFERMTAQQNRLEEYQTAQERERVADWFAIYHKHTDQSGFPSNPI